MGFSQIRLSLAQQFTKKKKKYRIEYLQIVKEIGKEYNKILKDCIICNNINWAHYKLITYIVHPVCD
jgi:hypothetical protein